jgi:hypothetical protein
MARLKRAAIQSQNGFSRRGLGFSREIEFFRSVLRRLSRTLTPESDNALIAICAAPNLMSFAAPKMESKKPGAGLIYHHSVCDPSK